MVPQSSILALILIITWNNAFSQDSLPQLKSISIQGSEGIYIFVQPEATVNGKKVSRILLEKKNPKKRSWSKVGEVNGPLSPLEIKKTIGTDLSRWLIESMNLVGEDALWDYFKNHHRPYDYGMASLHPSILIALGHALIDKQIKKVKQGQIICYRTLYYDSNGQLLHSISWEHEFIEFEDYNKAVSIGFNQSDSILFASWIAPLSPDKWPVWAKVYRINNSKGITELLSNRILAQINTTEDSVYYHLTDFIPGTGSFSYFIVPANFTGLESFPSDTITIYKDYNINPDSITIKSSPYQSETHYSIKHSNNNNQDSLSTLKSENEEVPDTEQEEKIKASGSLIINKDEGPDDIVYYFKLHHSGIRIGQIPYNTWQASTSNKNNNVPLPPHELNFSYDLDGLLLEWKTESHSDNVGYFVLRKTATENTWTTISPLLNTLSYTDEYQNIKKDTIYIYSVQALNINNELSIPSLPLYIRLEPEVKNTSILNKNNEKNTATKNANQPDISNIKPAPPIVRQIAGGIELSWDKTSQSQISEIIIYRRTSRQDKPIEIATINYNAAFFIDSPPFDIDIFYSIKYKSAQQISKSSNETKIKRKRLRN